MKHATVHNFADDNTISATFFVKLKKVLESESKCATKWLIKKCISANPDEFKSFIIDKIS